CAAGAMSLSRAADYLMAHPGGNVLIISVELASLTFQRKDITQANLISSILFGDGAAAVVVTGRKVPGPQILVTETYTFPDSLGAMGFDLRDSGFHILLAKDVPEMIGGKIRGLVDGFLSRNGKTQSDIRAGFFIPAAHVCLGTWNRNLGFASAIRNLHGTFSVTLAIFQALPFFLFFKNGWRSAL